ncbi:MAG: DUF2263 domain-containing protein [Bacteroidetes bacterium]|nr:DUF2263 domain-containing protein [Bacteroidota bacterium]
MSSAAVKSAEDEISQTVAERGAAYAEHSNAIISAISPTDSEYDRRHPEIITKSNITVALNGNTEQKQFYMQDLMIVDGDCLFSTLLGILKVARLKELQDKLNEAQYKNIKIEDSNQKKIDDYTHRNNPREFEAYKLRRILVDYAKNEESKNNYTLFTKARKVGQPLELEISEQGMTDLTHYGTNNEIAAATLLFKINIYVVHSDGIYADQWYRYQTDKTDKTDNNYYYIYNLNYSHYRNLWEVSPSHEDNYTQASELPDTAGKAMKPMSELIDESSSVAAAASSVAVAGAAAAAAATVVSSSVSSPERLTRGVVQVFEGDGQYHTSVSEDNKIFAPILKVIDRLIDEGYQHIGLTYSANQDQTIKIFEKYGYKKGGSSISNLSESIDNTELIGTEEWWPFGSGQAHVLNSLKTTLNDTKYRSIFRIIPFSTMEYRDASGGTAPQTSKPGSVDDCINFATLFLQQSGSIILGWSGIANFNAGRILNRKTVDNLLQTHTKLEVPSTDVITNYFSIGGDKCRNDVNKENSTSVKNDRVGKNLMNKYAEWALKHWNENSQKMVDGLRGSPSSSAAHVTVTPSKTQVPPILVYPPNDIISIINTRINVIVNHAVDATGTHVGRGKQSPPIAILVNGGSFNPIHNGHLEMYIRAREELMNSRHNYTDVLIIYCVSAFSELETKHESAPGLLFDKSGEKNRIKLCREAFACIDDVNERRGIQFAADGRHLSTNMFVWPEEDSLPYNNKSILSLSEDEGLNVTLFGLAGQDKVATPNYYFLNGINGNSIIVGRGGEGGSITNAIFAAPEGGFPEDTGMSYNPNLGKIAIPSGINISSSSIQPKIRDLRELTSKWAQYSGQNMFISDCSNPDCISFDDQDNIIQEFQKKMNSFPLSQVPKCILYQLLKYGLPPPKGQRDHNALLGYKQFRRFLFGVLINSSIYTKNGKLMMRNVPANVTQIRFDVTNVTDTKLTSKVTNKPIEFLQMTTGRALYIETKRKSPPPKVCILNFANANTVGGGVMNGETVQEETLCMMAPDLYLSLRVVAGDGTEDTTTGKKRYGNWRESKWNSQFYYGST